MICPFPFSILYVFSVAPHCKTKVQRAGLDPHLGVDILVGLGVEMGEIRDQGVETGRFRYM